MKGQKKNKDPCAGCVWRIWTGDESGLCFFPDCRRKEYDRLWGSKKQKLLEIPQATMEMLARCVATLKPPPELTLSQWADRYRMLSAESSAEPGRWHTDKAPHQREIMDAIGDAHIRRVVIMCAAQLGKTELLLNTLGYFMAYAPAPILVMQPTLDMGTDIQQRPLGPDDTRHAGAARAGGCEKPIRREHDLEKEFPRRAHHHSGREQRRRPCQPPY